LQRWVLTFPENEAFIYFSDHFKNKGLHVPEVLAVSEDRTIYLQNDLGDVSLLNVLEEKGYSEETYNLFRESLHQLARVQVLGDDGLKLRPLPYQ
jgi:aminoglycoside/choline kinase family phosphotransferase